MIQVDIESEELTTRNKKAGGTYQVQTAFLHTVSSTGSPERYPREVSVFPPRNSNNEVTPYKKGQYTLSDQSIRVENGFVAMGFVSLTPIRKAA